MKRSRVSSSQKDVDVAVTFMCRIFHDGIELFDLRNEFWVVVGEIAAKFRQDVDGFGTTVIGNQPPLCRVSVVLQRQ